MSVQRLASLSIRTNQSSEVRRVPLRSRVRRPKNRGGGIGVFEIIGDDPDRAAIRVAQCVVEVETVGAVSTRCDLNPSTLTMSCASVLWWPVRPRIRTTGLRDTPGAPYPQADSRLTVLKPYRTVAAEESNTTELVPTLTLDRSNVDTRADFERANPATNNVARTTNAKGLAMVTDALAAQAPRRGDGHQAPSPLPPCGRAECPCAADRLA